jgi:hypothetical protein
MQCINVLLCRSLLGTVKKLYKSVNLSSRSCFSYQDCWRTDRPHGYALTQRRLLFHLCMDHSVFKASTGFSDAAE